MTLLSPLLRLLGRDALHKLTSSSVTDLYTVEGDDRPWVDIASCLATLPAWRT